MTERELLYQTLTALAEALGDTITALQSNDSSQIAESFIKMARQRLSDAFELLLDLA